MNHKLKKINLQLFKKLSITWQSEKNRQFQGQLKQLFLVMVTVGFCHQALAKSKNHKAPVVLDPPMKEWTFLTYLNGHNNLDPFGKANIISMEKVGSNSQVNIVVQWASSKYPKTRRLLVEKSKDSSKVTSRIVEELPRVDMGDYHSLIEFIRWAHENYPAKHYFINVWNHGNGWKTKQISAEDISYDDFSGHKISTEELGLAMNEAAAIIGHKVDIYGSDACLMAGLEVASEMKHSVEYFVGSEELEPGEGWPYQQFLEPWLRQPDMEAKQVAQLLSSEYTKAYSGGVYGNQDVTFSAFDLNKLAAVEASTRQLSEDLLRLEDKQLDSVRVVSTRSQSFFYSDYVDFGDFLSRLSKDKNLSLQSVLQVQADLDQFIIANHVSAKYKDAKGAAIWFPGKEEWKSLKDRYSNLGFANGSNWHKVLDKVYRQ